MHEYDMSSLSTPHHHTPAHSFISIVSTSVRTNDIKPTMTSTTTLPEDRRCRYKTGKCHYPRALKTNKKDGTDAMLLLCERHRRLQNKTKKRSDTKYKADRAMLRVVKRLHPDLYTSRDSRSSCYLVPQSPASSSSTSTTTELSSCESNAAKRFQSTSEQFSPSELDMLAFYLL
ncbi:hypothetical protein AaE_016229 [Aphanomyces astaci]|uniref:Uncharacterized protein n=1 Tax=Aphanomyces astaci TaxID=112090 RepID=A0A6A4YXF7_APHAT|nr:hypothetical protein AaE_016229 [Aphanomyces astaci]